MARKTVNVKDLVERVNQRNQLSSCDPRVREGWNSLLEEVLHGSGNYQGFGYYESHQLGKDVPPGVIRGKDGEKNTFPDETRRFYYLSHNLR